MLEPAGTFRRRTSLFPRRLGSPSGRGAHPRAHRRARGAQPASSAQAPGPLPDRYRDGDVHDPWLYTTRPRGRGEGDGDAARLARAVARLAAHVQPASGAIGDELLVAADLDL